MGGAAVNRRRSRPRRRGEDRHRSATSASFIASRTPRTISVRRRAGRRRIREAAEDGRLAPPEGPNKTVRWKRATGTRRPARTAGPRGNRFSIGPGARKTPNSDSRSHLFDPSGVLFRILLWRLAW